MKTVIEMAREVGAGEPESLYGRTDYVVMTKFEFERFADLVRADAITDEREACIRIMFDYCDDNDACEKAAELIRARGNT